MPVSDLLHSLPGLLLWGVLPGLMLADLVDASVPWLTRIAVAPGLSAGLIGVLGAGLRLVHLPFGLVSGGIVLALLAVAVVVRRRRFPASDDRSVADPAQGRRHLALVLVSVAAGLVSCGALVATMSSALLPIWNDPAFHADLGSLIARSHDALPFMPIPAAGTGMYRPQMGMEATSVLVASTTGLSVAHVLVPVTALAVLVLPAGTAALAFEVSGSHLVAGAAALLGVGMALPSFVIDFGDFPLVLGSTLVLPTTVILMRWIRRGHRPSLVLVGFLAASIWVIHGSEAFTVGVLAAPMAVALLVEADPRSRAIRVVEAAAVAAAVAVALALLTAHPAVAPVPVAGGGSPAPSLAVADVVGSFFHVTLTTPIVVAAYGAGLVALILGRPGRWVLAAHLLMLVILIDRDSLHIFSFIWARLSVWAESDRLILMHYFALPFILATGGVAVIERAAAIRWLRRARPVVALALLAALGWQVVQGATYDLNRYTAFVAGHGVTTQADLDVMRRMDGLLPAGSLVLTNDSDDAGKWISALTLERVLLDKQWTAGYPDDWRIVALEHACDDPRRAEAAAAGAAAIFVGARDDVFARHHWDVACIRALPNVSEVAVATGPDGTAALFRTSPAP